MILRIKALCLLEEEDMIEALQERKQTIEVTYDPAIDKKKHLTLMKKFKVKISDPVFDHGAYLSKVTGEKGDLIGWMKAWGWDKEDIDDIVESIDLEITEEEAITAAEEIVEELVSEDEELSEKKKVKEEEIEIKADDDEDEDDEDEDDDDSEVKEKKKPVKEDKIDMSADVDALLEGEDFSEDFKLKATTIFEAAIGAKLASEKTLLEEKFQTKLDEATQEIEETLSGKVDQYLNYVVEEWAKDNAVALEHGIRSEISEQFLTGMRDLFVENFIDIPEEKLSIVESQFDEIEELTTQLNDVEKEKVALTTQVNEAKKDRILLSLSEDLAVTETEKFKELAENVDFESSELYEKKLIIIKEKYFPKDEKVSDLEETIPSTLSPEVSNNMAAYMAAISKNK
jgi:hypothetical protein